METVSQFEWISRCFLAFGIAFATRLNRSSSFHGPLGNFILETVRYEATERN